MVDETDIKILEILENDARMPWRRIAKMLGLSEATIYLRVNKMINEGIIDGFKVSLRVDKLGLNSVLIILIKADAKALKGLREEIRRRPYILEAHEITGDYQLLLKVVAPNHEAASSILEEIASLPGVLEISTIVSLVPIKMKGSVIEAYKYWSRVGQG
jgi:Lrp/AsnC family transcriptional regulator for asnA, asnC and gidA